MHNNYAHVIFYENRSKCIQFRNNVIETEKRDAAFLTYFLKLSNVAL